MRALKQEMDNKVEQFELCQKQLQVFTRIVAFCIINNEQDDLIRFVVFKNYLFSEQKYVNKKSCAFKDEKCAMDFVTE